MTALAKRLTAKNTRHTPAGAGAVVTDVQAALRRVWHVSDKGASPAALPSVNRASLNQSILELSAAGGGSLFFEPGTYLLSARLWWRDNVRLVSTSSTTLKIQDGVDDPVISIIDQQTTAPIKNIGAFGIIFDGNGVNAPGLGAPSAVILDPVDGGYFERCEFTGARGYGASLQFLATGVPNNERIKRIDFVKCDFHGNGFGLASGLGDKYDGIDVKNCNGLRFYSCRAFNNAEDGFDFRGENIDLFGCEAFGNGGRGLEISANSNGNSQNTTVRMFGGHIHTNGSGVKIANNPAGGSGVTRVQIDGATVRANTGVGYDFIPSNANTYAKVSGHIFANGGRGVQVSGAAKQIQIDAHIVSNGGDGIYCNAASALQITGGVIELNTGAGYIEGSNATRNNIAAGVKIFGNTGGNILLNDASRLTMVSSGVYDHTPNSSTSGDVIASAETITLPSGGSFFAITGTTNIANITSSHRGRVVYLNPQSVLTMLDGGNLRLNGNFVTSTGDIISLVCDGNAWYELSRSDN